MANSAAAPIVYVVDDDADVRDGLKALFQSVGLRCDVFASATQFLTRTVLGEVNCLILDVRMPGLSGLDLQNELVAAQINIPIVFLTGHGDIPMTVKAMKAGAVEFLTKPIREQDLLDAVRAGSSATESHASVKTRYALYATALKPSALGNAKSSPG